MAALLHDLIPVLARRPLSLYAATLLHSFSPEITSASQAEPGPPALIEPITGQEMRVLRLLAAGLTNPDIARELVVTTNTVKTHVKSIYRKLSVSSRQEVREVAKALKLL